MGDRAIEFIFKTANSVPFDELIRHLNGGYYLDTFEVGSVQIEEVSRPTPPRMKSKADIVDEILNRPWIDPDKFEDKKSNKPKKEIRLLGVKKQTGAYGICMSKKEVGCPGKLFEDDESEVRRILKEMSGSDLPPLLDNLDDSCIIQEKRCSIPSTKSKNDRTNSSSVIKSVYFSSAKPMKKVSSVSSCLTNIDDEETKIECTRRKMKKQYEDIENEKKRKRIKVIEHQKHLVTDQQQVTGRSVKRVPVVRKQQSKRLKLQPNIFVY